MGKALTFFDLFFFFFFAGLILASSANLNTHAQRILHGSIFASELGQVVGEGKGAKKQGPSIRLTIFRPLRNFQDGTEVHPCSRPHDAGKQPADQYALKLDWLDGMAKASAAEIGGAKFRRRLLHPTSARSGYLA